jgi:hypothetical protein
MYSVEIYENSRWEHSTFRNTEEMAIMTAQTFSNKMKVSVRVINKDTDREVWSQNK